MTISPRARFAAWTLVLAAAALFFVSCPAAAPAPAPAAPCAPAGAASSLSPAWLGRAAALAGPAPAWVPLALHARGGARGAPALALALTLALVLAAAAFLACVMPARYAFAAAVAAGMAPAAALDPSGHVLLYGLQLVPIWAAAASAHAGVPTAEAGPARQVGGPAPSPLLLAALCLEPLLFYLTAATGAFFHGALETLPAWLVTLVLAVATERTLAAAAARRELATGAAAQLPPAAAAERLASGAPASGAAALPEKGAAAALQDGGEGGEIAATDNNGGEEGARGLAPALALARGLVRPVAAAYALGLGLAAFASAGRADAWLLLAAHVAFDACVAAGVAALLHVPPRAAPAADAPGAEAAPPDAHADGGELLARRRSR
jgi:hypothetical protein